jgi:hypothetical protein
MPASGMVQDELDKASSATRTNSNPPSTAEKLAAAEVARQRFEAALFLMKSNQDKYGHLLRDSLKDYNEVRTHCTRTHLVPTS